MRIASTAETPKSFCNSAFSMFGRSSNVTPFACNADSAAEARACARNASNDANELVMRGRFCKTHQRD